MPVMALGAFNRAGLYGDTPLRTTTTTLIENYMALIASADLAGAGYRCGYTTKGGRADDTVCPALVGDLGFTASYDAVDMASHMDAE